MKLSKTLQRRMQAVRAGGVRFDRERRCFVDSVSGKKRRGLTKMLARMLPVPHAAGERSCAEKPSKRVASFSGATVRACHTCKAAIADAVRRGTVSGGERNSDRLHGAVVDEQLEVYAAQGREGLFRSFVAVDPCVGTLIEQLDAEGLVAYASQTPIYSEELGCATAVDLLATDRERGEQLVLIEVKATRAMSAESVREYEAARGVMMRGALKGVPLSYYARHQTQLLCMQHMLSRLCGMPVTRARVMRVAPGQVHTYPLAPHFAERGAAVAAAMQRNAQQRARRRKRQQAR